jgi:hypothetical protein
VVAAAVITGCGSMKPPSRKTSGNPAPASNSESRQYASTGNALCKRVLNELAALPKPTVPTQVAAYLTRALAIGERELAGLQALHAPVDAQAPLHDALARAGREDTIERTGVREIEAGRPIASVFSAIQSQLNALEPRTNAEFREAGLPECAK